jgi:hypothetical protein
MCLPFDAWCCCFCAVPDHEDDYHGSSSGKGGSMPPQHHAVAPKTTTHYPPAQRNGCLGTAATHHVGGHRAPPPHHHQQLPVADEEDRKASNDVRRKGHAPAPGAAAERRALTGYVTGAEEKAYVYAAPDGALKQHPAANVVVADGAGHGAHYYYQREPAHKEYYQYR